MKRDILSMSLTELQEFVTGELDERSFRAKQIFEWLHIKLARDFDEMTNLSKALRAKLKEKAFIEKLEIADLFISKVDGTRKYLFKLRDNNIIECVMMPYKFGDSVCVSSQVGCRMGCSFCASTIDGLERNLTASEIICEIYSVVRDIGKRISNVVIMGSGEPLDNYDNVVRFIRRISDSDGFDLSQRSITLSTCGIVPKIYKLADEKLQITLAVSLHEADDEKRKELMPVAGTYSIDEIIKACRNYYAANNRRLTFEYSLIKDKNDSPEDADMIANVVKGLNCFINLIPINPVEERSYCQTSRDRVLEFKNKLEKSGVNVNIRREMGRDISAACGQLRKRYMDKR